MNEKTSIINLPEMTKLLKDHGLLPNLITKDELAMIFKLMSVKQGNRAEATPLNYQGHTNLLSQVAFLSFGRDPKDLSHLPLV